MLHDNLVHGYPLTLVDNARAYPSGSAASRSQTFAAIAAISKANFRLEQQHRREIEFLQQREEHLLAAIDRLLLTATKSTHD
jgi:hypothetical protein